MTFWDTSAVVLLLVEQPSTAQALKWAEQDPELVVWWGTVIECASAAARLRREGVIDVAGEAQVSRTLDAFRDAWIEIQPSDELRDVARRLLRVHVLRTGDALQLAAALLWAGRPADHVMITFDERLALAARLEGFEVRPA